MALAASGDGILGGMAFWNGLAVILFQLKFVAALNQLLQIYWSIG
jgi:hypothetical protein